MTLRPTITVLFSVLLLSTSCGKDNPVSGGLVGFYELTRAVIDPPGSRQPDVEQLPPKASGGLLINTDGTYNLVFGLDNPWFSVFTDEGTFEITNLLITFTSTDQFGIRHLGRIGPEAGTIKIIRTLVSALNRDVFVSLTFERTLSL